MSKPLQLLLYIFTICVGLPGCWLVFDLARGVSDINPAWVDPAHLPAFQGLLGIAFCTFAAVLIWCARRA